MRAVDVEIVRFLRNFLERGGIAGKWKRRGYGAEVFGEMVRVFEKVVRRVLIVSIPNLLSLCFRSGFVLASFCRHDGFRVVLPWGGDGSELSFI